MFGSSISSDGATAASTSVSTSSTATSTQHASSTSESNAAAPSSSAFSCPSQNGTFYTSPTDNTVFYRYCDLNAPYNDINGPNTSTLPQLTFDACMDLCAATGPCVGVVHGKTNVNGIDNCWLKTLLATPYLQADTCDMAQRYCGGEPCAGASS